MFGIRNPFEKKEDELLKEYAVILWDNVIASNPQAYGDDFKQIFYYSYGKQEFLPYDEPTLSLLKMKKIPIRDTTFNLNKPLERIKPNSINVIRQGLVSIPKEGFKPR